MSEPEKHHFNSDSTELTCPCSVAVELGAPTLCALRRFVGIDGETLFPGDCAQTGTDSSSLEAGKTKKGKVTKAFFKLFGKYWITGKLKLLLSEKYKERIYNSSC